jgi:hypothetical protein
VKKIIHRFVRGVDKFSTSITAVCHTDTLKIIKLCPIFEIYFNDAGQKRLFHFPLPKLFIFTFFLLHSHARHFLAHIHKIKLLFSVIHENLLVLYMKFFSHVRNQSATSTKSKRLCAKLDSWRMMCDENLFYTQKWIFSLLLFTLNLISLSLSFTHSFHVNFVRDIFGIFIFHL